LIKRPEYIVVGRFGRPRGLSGEIFINPLTDNAERFKGTGKFWIESGKTLTEIAITIRRFVSGRPVGKVEGIDSPEGAGKLNNRFIYVRGADLHELPEGRYFYFDLIGCNVRDDNGRGLGLVTAVESYPANDVWVIRGKDGKEYLFPAVKKYVKKVDIENKVIVLDPPEGIFDSPDED